MPSVAYLACPYSHPDPKVRQERAETVTRVAGQLIRQGIFVYSPLTHNLPFVEMLSLPTGWMNWAAFDHEMVSRCDRLFVLKLPGWEESKGVAAEVAHAQSLGLPIEWLEYSPELAGVLES